MTLQMYTEDVSQVEQKEQKSSSPIQPSSQVATEKKSPLKPVTEEKPAEPVKRKRVSKKQDKPKRVVKKQKKEIGTKRASHKMKKDPRSKQSLLKSKKNLSTVGMKTLKTKKQPMKKRTLVPKQSLKSKTK